MTERLKKAIEDVLDAYVAGEIQNTYYCDEHNDCDEARNRVNAIMAELEEAYDEEAEG